MATTKAYTDIHQSEILSKILSPESADMWYHPDFNYGNLPDFTRRVAVENIPCWSLTALLNAVDFSTINLHYDKARMDWVASATIYDSTKHCTKYESARALNPIDAAYSLVILGSTIPNNLKDNVHE